jgi:hypothetical protein
LHQQLRDHLGGSKIVFHRVQVSRGIQPLQQHRSRTGIMLQQPHCSTSRPRPERSRLAAGLVINRLQLEYRFRTIAPRDWNDQGNGTRRNLAVDDQLPPLHGANSHCR